MSTFIQGPIPKSLKSAELGNLGWGSGKLLPLSNQTKPWESILQILNFNFLPSPNYFFFWEKPRAFCWASCPAMTHRSYGFDCYSWLSDTQFMRRNEELWIANHWFSTGLRGCCICHQDHKELFCSEIGGRIVLNFLVLTNFDVNMIPGVVCVIPAWNPIKISHFYGLKKGYKRHPTPLVQFIRGDGHLSNFPTWNNSQGGMGWVCTSGKGFFFPSCTKLFSSPVVIPFLSSLIDALL